MRRKGGSGETKGDGNRIHRAANDFLRVSLRLSRADVEAILIVFFRNANESSEGTKYCGMDCLIQLLAPCFSDSLPCINLT